MTGDLPREVLDAVRRMRLVGPDETPQTEALSGGVASDIWRIDAAGGPFCVKRALARLKVAADWRAPVERNVYEVAWFRVAGALVPEAVPAILGHDATAGLFAMAWLEPSRHRLWKADLLAGVVDPAVAWAVGDRLGRIHAGSAARPELAVEFATDAIFHAIRLEPYLEAAARAHPDRAEILHALVARTAATRRCLVHGDVSPKNIQVGPHGPILLDAECAWWGDPAFDVAFCLNHLLLKALHVKRAAADLLESFDRLWAGYRARVDWEPADAVEARIATLLPGLFLARVDGKSPVEYLTDEAERARVRGKAREWLAEPVERLAALRDDWTREIAG
ncbi:putative aminoglycoside phosphotransferase [Thalassobaculum fulvum]|uniref:Aminoglycoside phosphotransferase n=1 Tax=Thalassobaculum fulvum TaxID=1633335 RepID=A0A919CPR3_9PROT|nr:phosphotransferase [Thalassobaculum fulvum]GHD51611.1 putative aminoglycoside phosphotransferase [Thalassobaculum fulvum]